MNLGSVLILLLLLLVLLLLLGSAGSLSTTSLGRGVGLLLLGRTEVGRGSRGGGRGGVGGRGLLGSRGALLLLGSGRRLLLLLGSGRLGSIGLGLLGGHVGGYSGKERRYSYEMRDHTRFLSMNSHLEAISKLIDQLTSI